jgi:hypothetical protein
MVLALRRRLSQIALLVVFGAAGALTGAAITRHSAQELRRVSVVAGLIFGWAVLGLVAAWVSMAAERRKEGAPSTSGSSDWPAINAEMVREAERIAARAWLFSLTIGLGMTGELLLLSRSLLFLTAAPVLVLGSWLLVRRSATDARKLIAPVDPETARYWNRTRSP